MNDNALQRTAACAPSPSAERMRQFRRRRRYRRLSIRTEVNQDVIDALIDRGYVEAAQRDNQAAIGEAVAAFISDELVFKKVTA
jgi:hypothetical protein